jgi:predicted 3-demethylubiquinone-9 3-methyltransferase (glyoxalase superfamily)
MQKISTCLWFDGQAEEAAKFYTSIFKNAKIGQIMRTSEAGPGPKGSVLTVTFELEGHEFMALNGGPHFKFTPAISMFVKCKTQEEIDELWAKLTAGGKEVECGWLTDKFGVSWQIVPAEIGELLGAGDSKKSARVIKAIMQMKKLDLNVLRRAYQQE